MTSLAPDRYEITFMASAATCQKLRQAQDLLRHQVPDGNPAEIFDRALSALLEDLARKKLGASNRPRRGRSVARGSRHIPAEVKRAVWLPDGGRCAFVLRCRPHNGYEADLYFGPREAPGREDVPEAPVPHGVTGCATRSGTSCATTAHTGLPPT